MQTHEFETLKTQLEKIHELFRRKLSPGIWRVWVDCVFTKYEFVECWEALNKIVTLVRHMPTPKDVDDLICEIRKVNGVKTEFVYKGCDPLTKKALADDLKNANAIRCDEKIAAAWSMFIKKVHGEVYAPKATYPGLTFAEAVEIVNRESVRLGHDLPAEYRLNEFWHGNQQN